MIVIPLSPDAHKLYPGSWLQTDDRGVAGQVDQLDGRAHVGAVDQVGLDAAGLVARSQRGPRLGGNNHHVAATTSPNRVYTRVNAQAGAST